MFNEIVDELRKGRLDSAIPLIRAAAAKLGMFLFFTPSDVAAVGVFDDKIEIMLKTGLKVGLKPNRGWVGTAFFDIHKEEKKAEQK